MTINWRALIIPAVMLALSLVAWHYHGVYLIEQKRADDAATLAGQRQEIINDMTVRQRDVSALDERYTRELSDAKKTISDLRRDVDSGAKRLRIAATCPGVRKTTATSGMDDAGTPELTPDARRNYYDHRDGIHTVDKMIRGMQDYINTQCLK